MSKNPIKIYQPNCVQLVLHSIKFEQKMSADQLKINSSSYITYLFKQEELWRANCFKITRNILRLRKKIIIFR